MKKITEMTESELKNEMKTYVCNKRENYIFISYSHMDNKVVLPIVLSWMREGYNIYIDLDFDRHGSEENWLVMMRDVVENARCKLAVCFQSENYMYSHAAMIEIFTMRSLRTRRLRVENDLSVFVVSVGNHENAKKVSFSCERVEKTYAKKFAGMKKRSTSFAEGNIREKELFENGIKDWYACLPKNPRIDMLSVYPDADSLINLINENYKKEEAANYYYSIATAMLMWFESMDLENCTFESAVLLESYRNDETGHSFGNEKKEYAKVIEHKFDEMNVFVDTVRNRNIHRQMDELNREELFSEYTLIEDTKRPDALKEELIVEKELSLKELQELVWIQFHKDEALLSAGMDVYPRIQKDENGKEFLLIEYSDINGEYDTTIGISSTFIEINGCRYDNDVLSLKRIASVMLPKECMIYSTAMLSDNESPLSTGRCKYNDIREQFPYFVPLFEDIISDDHFGYEDFSIGNSGYAVYGLIYNENQCCPVIVSKKQTRGLLSVMEFNNPDTDKVKYIFKNAIMDSEGFIFIDSYGDYRIRIDNEMIVIFDDAFLQPKEIQLSNSELFIEAINELDRIHLSEEGLNNLISKIWQDYRFDYFNQNEQNNNSIALMSYPERLNNNSEVGNYNIENRKGIIWEFDVFSISGFGNRTFNKLYTIAIDRNNIYLDYERISFASRYILEFLSSLNNIDYWGTEKNKANIGKLRLPINGNSSYNGEISFSPNGNSISIYQPVFSQNNDSDNEDAKDERALNNNLKNKVKEYIRFEKDGRIAELGVHEMWILDTHNMTKIYRRSVIYDSLEYLNKNHYTISEAMNSVDFEYGGSARVNKKILLQQGEGLEKNGKAIESLADNTFDLLKSNGVPVRRRNKGKDRNGWWYFKCYRSFYIRRNKIFVDSELFIQNKDVCQIDILSFILDDLINENMYDGSYEVHYCMPLYYDKVKRVLYYFGRNKADECKASVYYLDNENNDSSANAFYEPDGEDEQEESLLNLLACFEKTDSRIKKTMSICNKLNVLGIKENRIRVLNDYSLFEIMPEGIICRSVLSNDRNDYVLIETKDIYDSAILLDDYESIKEKYRKDS